MLVTEPIPEYTKRLEKFSAIIAAKNRLHIHIGNLKMFVIGCGLVMAWLVLAKHWFAGYWLFVLAAAYLGLAICHEYILRQKTAAETAANFYRKGIARVEDRWAGSGPTGDRFRDDKHVYSSDLDLFGRGCLFELLSTARLPMGEEKLAGWLLGGSSKAEIWERQKQVGELRAKLDLREDLAVTGEALRTRLDPRALLEWAESPRVLPGGVWRGVTAALAIAVVAATVYCFWTDVYWPLSAVLIAEVFFRRWLIKRAKAVTENVAANAEGLILFAHILRRLEAEPFTAESLRAFSEKLKREGDEASRAIRKLAGVVYWIDAEHSLLAHLVELPLLYSVQVAFAAEAWRARWGKRVRAWADITGEMEALLSLAGYAFEHPGDVFPVFVEAEKAGPLFEGQELAHPLIAAVQCVRNSVRLDAHTRALLVSGSNMSGKSTLLRTVGINTILAMAGAPIRGRSLRLTPLLLGTRIRSGDSLQEGRSNFYTEILHIRQVFELAGKSEPLLFLFDELLEGTNSKDRRIGAESLIRGLLKHGAIGIVSTHDLALTEISNSLGGMLRNVHLQDEVVNGEMRFDYRLRDGVVAKSNAIELMRLIGLEID